MVRASVEMDDRVFDWLDLKEMLKSNGLMEEKSEGGEKAPIFLLLQSRGNEGDLP